MMGQVNLSFHDAILQYALTTTLCCISVFFLFTFLFVIYVFCESTVVHNSLDKHIFHTLWCMFLHTAFAAFHANQ
jgi:hypothetical protein